MKRRTICLLTILCMLLSILPAFAEAAENLITITQQPEAIRTVQYKETGKAPLTVKAQNTQRENMRYQWYKNTANSNEGGTPVGTGASYYLPFDLEIGTHYYYCVVSIGSESVRSEVATVIVEPAPTTIGIRYQPTDKIELTKGVGINETLRVTAYASTYVDLSYQWYVNTVSDVNSGTPIPGATDYLLQISPFELEGGTYYYYCKISAPGAEPVYTRVTTVTVKVKESQSAPPAPILQSKTHDSITLTYVSGVEYSVDGKTWYDRTITGLTSETTYSVYARYKATYTQYASPMSEPLVVKTTKAYKDKGEQKPPAGLSVLSKTGTSITLVPIEGAEYTMDHKTWQDSSTFYNLKPSTRYQFYARMKETDELKESAECYPITATTDVSGGFPFIPKQNLTDGVIKSGWAYLMTRSGGSLASDSQGVVNPSYGGYSAFFFEHLGNNDYYIRGANGGYLSYEKLELGAKLIISENPCTWRVYAENAGGYVEYNICVASNTKYLIKLGGGDGEDIPDNVSKLTYTTSKYFQRDGAQFTIITLDPRQQGLPQWWREYYVEGRTEPSYFVETITYEHPTPQRPSGGQDSSGGTSSGQNPSEDTPGKEDPVTPPVTVTAEPSQTRFVMDGKPVSVTAAYTINGTNYLQIRAIAAMLNGTAAQFDVGYDGQYAVIEPGKPFSGTVTATKLQKTTDVQKSGTKFKMNGEVFTFSDARLIDGGTNYIQLREFAQKLSGTASQFNVYWDDTARQAVIQPGVPYTGYALIIETPDDTDTAVEETKNETYFFKASKNQNLVIEVAGASEENGAKLQLGTWTGKDNQKFKLVKVEEGTYIIMCIHTFKSWKSSGKKGDTLIQSTLEQDGSAFAFKIVKQADGTYRIMDSAGLYAGVSNTKIENGSKIILGTEGESQTFILERVD